MKQEGVIGVDEVGRGPLAGPITVCAFYTNDTKKLKKEFFLDKIRDSKKLSKYNRNSIYLTIRNKRELKYTILYAVFSKSAKYIDKHGLTKATSACVLACVKNLEKQGVDMAKVVVNLDAGLRVPLESIQQKSFVKGDERFVEIALASIMAKETRDSYMKKLAKAHPEYKWEENVGYGTKYHREAIKKVGITDYHRISFLKAFKLFNKAD